MYLESRDATANATELPHPPYAFAPSGSWDGNDGLWSTFMINTGDAKGSGDGQNFRVLISTSSSITQVPAEAPWCRDAECAKKRGIELDGAQQPLGLNTDVSTTGWSEQGLFALPLPDYWSGGNLNGSWGTMPVGLGTTSRSSWVQPDQLVVTNANADLFMGAFGLGYNAISTGSSPQKPWLTNMNESGALIPSASYGYGAGASYKNGGKGTLGSLILGGYDLSRFQNTSRIDIGFPNSRNTSLVVAVQNIVYHPDRNVDANDYSLTPNSTDSFNAVIDSELPYLEMPENICDNFADKFQLTYDEEHNLYTVSSSAHNHNTQQNATVAFKIGRDLASTNTATTIQLPYAAFDLQGSAPLFTNTTQYFPLRRATTGQNVLGRAFLQEAYIIVDYENWRFTVAPATFSDPMPSADVQTIYRKGYQLPANTTAVGGRSGGSDLSGGAIAGIVVGIVAVLGLLAAGAFFFWKRRRQQQRKLDEKASETDIDTVQAGEQVKTRRISELDSEAPSSPKTSVGGYYNRERKDDSPFPPISEMESPPAELYSPPPESLTALSTETPQSDRDNYFVVGNKVRRRGATRESSGHNTPGTPAAVVAELPGDDGKFTVDGQHFDPIASPAQSPVHSRGGSDASQSSGIDEIVAGARHDAGGQSDQRRSQSRPRDSSVPSKIDEVMARHRDEAGQTSERAASHSRVRSDATVASESTAVSQPTAEELESWAMGSGEPRRPLSE
ncbi:acid protease [Lophiostoma macrostomum CBS 122681]|uniref:Acid protease n=1 Tax=Lophiostoma macrostomum CBS 122681 TaxID=1314788 RepID=A0A6A6TI86_9PLEO|nr:acid protease [Lophiostoma macrostomum CBS 122681]